ncbi:hypothetical protein [Stakelama saccharophila]|uniref:VanZ-like domain-containing protein n=1 Tax=Stakelama saccharophila TaxID=3075605 RepID=A0ABZ0B6J6_9SPHN|nr:hypothetical protein [Stakelama sp. W311]WNO53031.1 hypothetical protein RPR59_11265 [Stakelama sp. W311]
MHELAARYHAMIEWISGGTEANDSLLHVHAGLALMLLARIITRRSLGSFVPLLVVIVAEAGNEIMDRIHAGSWRWTDTSSDIVNTLFWPAVICLGIRLRPLLPKLIARHPLSPRPQETSPEMAHVRERSDDAAAVEGARPLRQ